MLIGPPAATIRISDVVVELMLTTAPLESWSPTDVDGVPGSGVDVDHSGAAGGGDDRVVGTRIGNDGGRPGDGEHLGGGVIGRLASRAEPCRLAGAVSVEGDVVKPPVTG